MWLVETKMKLAGIKFILFIGRRRISGNILLQRSFCVNGLGWLHCVQGRWMGLGFVQNFSSLQNLKASVCNLFKKVQEMSDIRFLKFYLFYWITQLIHVDQFLNNHLIIGMSFLGSVSYSKKDTYNFPPSFYEAQLAKSL